MFTNTVFDRSVQALLKAMNDIEAHKGQEGYRHDYDKAIHLFCALQNAGLKVIRDNKAKKN